MRLLAALLLPLPAFAQEAAEPTEWLGPTPHLILVGTLAGHPVDIRMPDMAAAQGVARFEGKREYLPAEGGGWRYGDFEVVLDATLGGVERRFEMELENHDFLEHPLPASFELGAENFPRGARAFLEAEAEWETAEGAVNEELGGWTGRLTLHEDSGTPDAEGLLPDGRIAGFLVAEREGERLVMSFTVPVGGYEKDE
jgi:hypothetical protein